MVKQTDKVVFLDFDGVVLTDKSTDEHGYGVFKPEAAALIAKLCAETGAKLVVCSSWLGYWDDDVIDQLKQAGLDGYLHDDWRIGQLNHNVVSIQKGNLIREWIDNHGAKPKQVVILDDQLTLPQYLLPPMWKERVVSPDPEVGFAFGDYVQAKHMLGLPLDPVSEKPILGKTQRQR